MVSYSRLRPEISRLDPCLTCAMSSPFGHKAHDRTLQICKASWAMRRAAPDHSGVVPRSFSIESVHRHHEPVADDALHRLGGPAVELGQGCALGALEVGQEIVDRVDLARSRSPDTHT